MTSVSRSGLRAVGGRLLLAGLSAVLCLGVAEIVLRVRGFEFHLMPTIQFGWPDPVTLHDRYRDDPDLFWVLRDYRDRLAQARATHPAIVFMGDSCTEFGTYPAVTLAALAAAKEPVSTGVSLGTGGWSSSQGLEQLRRDVLGLHPRVVTIYYGWNDHWVALGPTDSELERWRWLLAFAEHSRLAELIVKARFGLSVPTAERPNRVPIDAYRANLSEMVRLARHNGIAPVLITAPTNHVPGQEPAYLAARHLRNLSELVPLHQQYLNVVRDVARQDGAVLCDLAKDFAALPPAPTPRFLADGIHLTPAGDHEVARLLLPCIVQAASSR
jgi:lysophospholipase L1-like esterase